MPPKARRSSTQPAANTSGVKAQRTGVKAVRSGDSPAPAKPVKAKVAPKPTPKSNPPFKAKGTGSSGGFSTGTGTVSGQPKNFASGGIYGPYPTTTTPGANTPAATPKTPRVRLNRNDK